MAFFMPEEVDGSWFGNCVSAAGITIVRNKNAMMIVVIVCWLFNNAASIETI
jgi:hypothetical protein